MNDRPKLRVLDLFSATVGFCLGMGVMSAIKGDIIYAFWKGLVG